MNINIFFPRESKCIATSFTLKSPNTTHLDWTNVPDVKMSDEIR